MRRLLIAVLCAVSVTAQAQISPAVTAALVPNDLFTQPIKEVFKPKDNPLF